MKFDKEDIKAFPKVEWVTNHSFKYQIKNQIYLFNTKGRKPVSYLKFDGKFKKWEL